VRNQIFILYFTDEYSCFSWEYEDVKGNQTLDTAETVVIGWVRAKQRPNSPSDPDSIIPMHEGAGGMVPSDPKKVSSKDYDKYAAMKPITDSTPESPAKPKAQPSPKPVAKEASGGKPAKSGSPSAAGPKTGSAGGKGKAN
jgi:Cytochrome domain of cellobiose dehydrogenase